MDNVSRSSKGVVVEGMTFFFKTEWAEKLLYLPDERDLQGQIQGDSLN